MTADAVEHDGPTIQAENSQNLYHYTSIEGLHGILRAAQLWGTHIAYLNDLHELTLGLDVACQLMRDCVVELVSPPDPDSPPQSRSSAENWHSFVIGYVNGIYEMKELYQTTLSPYVACLSRSRDQLSQWRGYAKGGYSIGFNTVELERSMRVVDPRGETVKTARKPQLTEVIYVSDPTDSELSGARDAIRRKLHSNLTAWGGAEGRASKSEQDLRGDIMTLATRIKNRAFREEQEYRIQIPFSRESFFDPSTLGLVPRTTFAFDPSAIREIIVGPHEHAKTRQQSILNWLGRNRTHPYEMPAGIAKYSHAIPVRLSEVPYREI